MAYRCRFFSIAGNSGIKVQIATKNPQQYIDMFRNYIGLEFDLVKVKEDLFDVKLK